MNLPAVRTARVARLPGTGELPVQFCRRIGDEAWVAADAFVGPGVSVGDRSVVGARATVVKDVPVDVVVAGNPARVVKPRLLRD